jgi:hypothetical protein
VGDITDEHDIAVPGVRPQPDGSVNVVSGHPRRARGPGSRAHALRLRARS